MNETKKTLRNLLINIIILGIVVAGTLSVFIVRSLSWYSNNKTVKATGLNVTVSDSVLADAELYEYLTVGGEFTKVNEIGLSMMPGEHSLFVLIVYNDEDVSGIDFNYGLSDLKVNYYGLQQHSTADSLDGFLYGYRMAGPYVTNGVTKSFGKDITTAEYLKFISPATNAIKVRTAVVTVSKSVLVDQEGNPVLPSVYYNNLLATDSVNFEEEYGTLYTTSENENGVWQSVILDADIDADFAVAESASSGSGSEEDVQPDMVSAVIFDFMFDESVVSSALLSGDTEITEMQNSNAYMYQRITIGRLFCHVSRHQAAGE